MVVLILTLFAGWAGNNAQSQSTITQRFQTMETCEQFAKSYAEQVDKKLTYAHGLAGMNVRKDFQIVHVCQRDAVP
jgi:hypothetical protein